MWLLLLQVFQHAEIGVRQRPEEALPTFPVRRGGAQMNIKTSFQLLVALLHPPPPPPLLLVLSTSSSSTHCPIQDSVVSTRFVLVIRTPFVCKCLLNDVEVPALVDSVFQPIGNHFARLFLFFLGGSSGLLSQPPPSATHSGTFQTDSFITICSESQPPPPTSTQSATLIEDVPNNRIEEMLRDALGQGREGGRRGGRGRAKI